MNVGDRFIETTPSGNVVHLAVTEVDVEPKYAQPEADYPFVRLRSAYGKEFVMSERVIAAVDWIEPAP